MLNLPRLQSRHALAVALGVAMAMSRSSVSAEAMEGAARNAAQAQAIADRINYERHLRRVREKARGGLAGVMNG